MNTKIKKLISFLSLEARTNSLNCVIGYLNSLDLSEDANWNELLKHIIKFDYTIIEIFNRDNNTDLLKEYGIILNNIYIFINEEYVVDFINEAPFNNNRVANINNFAIYLQARRLLLNEYEKNKGGS